jgi:hypothetical protein
MNEEEIAALCVVERCRCCHRPLKLGTRSGWCKRRPCRQHRYQHDELYRAAKLARNAAWARKKAEQDSAWAALRKQRQRDRMAALRQAARREVQK